LGQKPDTYINAVLNGPATVVADHSWSHGKSVVLEVRDADGVVWFVKQHRDVDEYQSELLAYGRWVPALGDRAPTLHAYDDDLQVLVLSALRADGSANWRDPEVQRDAGTVLWRLHDAEIIGQWDDIAAEKQAQLERWETRAVGLLTDRELSFVRAELRLLEDLPAPVRVPCHLDYSPRNWLIMEGRVHVIDFEDAAPEVWINDLGPLYFRWWRDPRSPGEPRADPVLQDAFFDGYGRYLNDDDLLLLRASYALTAFRDVILARQFGQVAHEASLRAVLQSLMKAS
jgi:hypothetical protein